MKLHMKWFSVLSQHLSCKYGQAYLTVCENACVYEGAPPAFYLINYNLNYDSIVWTAAKLSYLTGTNHLLENQPLLTVMNNQPSF